MEIQNILKKYRTYNYQNNKKYLLEDEDQEKYNNDDILLEVGISRYPEILEFCGDLEYFIKNEKIEYKKETIRKLY